MAQNFLYEFPFADMFFFKKKKKHPQKTPPFLKITWNKFIIKLSHVLELLGLPAILVEGAFVTTCET